MFDAVGLRIMLALAQTCYHHSCATVAELEEPLLERAKHPGSHAELVLNWSPAVLIASFDAPAIRQHRTPIAR